MKDPIKKYEGYETLAIEPGQVITATEYVYRELSCRIVDEDGKVYEMDGSLCVDQELPTL